jgi:glycosyltransferase involved in cell wall biosynthesis
MPALPPLTVPADNRTRLLLFNLRTDADDHILGFTTQWINALAAYYDALDVLTMHRGRLAVAENVRVFSAGREAGATKTRRVLNFYARLSYLLATQHYQACFAHMMPLFAAMGAPLLTLRGVPVTTWYTHRARNQQVIWAERLSYRVVSAVPSSFPVDTPKLRAIGHGIDTGFFHPADTSPAGNLPQVVQVARLTDIKHQHVLLQAAEPLRCEIVFVGDIPDGYDDSYKKRLQRLVDDLGMRDRVTFAGAQPADRVRDFYQQATVAVNLSPPGLFDKAALESMACAVPTLVSNPAFQPLTGDHTDLLQVSAPDAVDEVRLRLKGLLAYSGAGRARIGADLREAVVAQHSLAALVRRLIQVMHTGEPA